MSYFGKEGKMKYRRDSVLFKVRLIDWYNSEEEKIKIIYICVERNNVKRSDVFKIAEGIASNFAIENDLFLDNIDYA